MITSHALYQLSHVSRINKSNFFLIQETGTCSIVCFLFVVVSSTLSENAEYSGVQSTTMSTKYTLQN